MRNNLIQIIEAALFSASEPLTIDNLVKLFPEDEKPKAQEVRKALTELKKMNENRGVHLVEVASGFRYQVAADIVPHLANTTEENKPTRYSRALLETLAIIAYRQPITRGEIEDIRGVVVSTHIVKTLDEHEWIRVVGHKDVPGKPALYATTKTFLDHFNLKSLEELPPLAELKNLEDLWNVTPVEEPVVSEEMMGPLPVVHEEMVAEIAETAIEIEETELPIEVVPETEESESHALA